MPSDDQQEQTMLLMASAFKAEDAAESILKGKESQETYDKLVQQYHQIRQSLIKPGEELVSEGASALLGPNPVQTEDL